MDIKRTIKSRGFTLVQVAEALGITKGALSQSLSRQSVTTNTLEKIANVIGCKPVDFYLESEKDESEKQTYIVCPHCGERIKISVEK